MKYTHLPIMIDAVIKSFEPVFDHSDAIFVDGTLGLAGHSLAIAEQCKIRRLEFKIIGVDKDAAALGIAQKRIKESGIADNFIFVHDDFNNFEIILQNLNIAAIDGILLDLGVSSMQLDDKSRGFSFSDPDMKLDMRMDKDQPLSAETVVNEYTQQELERVLKNGEEWNYRKVAREICTVRTEKKITTVGELLQILEAALPKRYSRTHFATDTFRALRLEVNNEINRLGATIQTMVKLLRPKGRLAIITFHSVEDRIVKDTFNQLANPCICPPKLPYCVCGRKAKIRVINKKPFTADDLELANNPRARSAKLRIIEKI